jgi:hypothetical protein
VQAQRLPVARLPIERGRFLAVRLTCNSVAGTPDTSATGPVKLHAGGATTADSERVEEVQENRVALEQALRKQCSRSFHALLAARGLVVIVPDLSSSP